MIKTLTFEEALNCNDGKILESNNLREDHFLFGNKTARQAFNYSVCSSADRVTAKKKHRPVTYHAAN